MKTAALPIVAMVVVQLTAATNLAEAEATSGRSCPQALAAYATEDQRVAVEFTGAPDLSFWLLVEGLDGKFEGYTYPAEGEDGTEGVALDNCPDGDATGEEIAACTVWQGQVQAIGADETIGNLPLSGEPAAGSLRLVGLAGALNERLPDLFTDPPNDKIEKLTLSACQE
ncbi:MAG: hypothetical protein GY789_21845 [Hyphomicrobiales bacterium]|nr:hypothetical protein [Hyphomicrobiales bacterium]MCP5001164.1 hypothetical protein [Hyphomicrobiales bacterium]